jgi:hypothetical protein
MLTFGNAEKYQEQIRVALSETMWFTSFVTGVEGAPEDSKLSERWSGRPAVYAIVYRDGSPPSHPELERQAFGLHGGGFFYVGKTCDAWRRFREHRISLGSACWPGGPELSQFWYFAMPVAVEWQIHSFEQLVIDLLKPIFNDVVTGLGAGGETDFLLYLRNPEALTDTERLERNRLVERITTAVDDLDGRPLLWFDEAAPHEPAIARWLAEMDRSGP